MSKLRQPNSGRKLAGSGGGQVNPPSVDSEPLSKPVLNKAVFMSNICDCLESCSGYIQTLNSLCAAGTVLAHSLIQVFHELPPYRDLSEQFMNTWEDLSKATASASAAVKTETLMSLQEVLIRLEDENDSGSHTFFYDNIAAVSSCLISYVELQAQFSLSCWKSLSNLSKTLSTDALFFMPPPKSDDGSQRTIDLTSSIRKYFAQLVRKYEASNSSPKHSDVFQERSQQYSAGMWPVLTSYSLPSFVSAQQPCAISSPKEASSKKESLSSDLEGVINLLSCKPNEAGKPEGSTTPNGQSPWLFSKEASSSSEPSVNQSAVDVFCCPPVTPLQYDGKQTWPRMGSSSTNPFGYDSWIWGQAGSHHLLESQKLPISSGMWCSGSSGSTQRWSSGQGENGSSSDDCSSNTGHDSDVFSLGLDLTGADLVASVRHRRHSSNDGFPESGHGEVEDNSRKYNNVPSWETKCSKTSTWPLKQSSPRVADPLVGVAFSPPPPSMWPMGEEEEKQAKKYTLFGQMA